MDDGLLIDLFRQYSAENPMATRPHKIPFGVFQIMQADSMEVPADGVVRMRCLRRSPAVHMGFDIGLKGHFETASGGTIAGTLRTWWEEDLEDMVSYRYHSKNGVLRLTTSQRFPDDDLDEDDWFVDQWSGNSAMWCEMIGGDPFHREYHCNHRDTNPATFDDLVIEVVIMPVDTSPGDR